MDILRFRHKKNWYSIYSHEDNNDGWGVTSDRIFEVAHKLHIKVGHYQMQGCRFVGVYGTGKDIRALMSVLGKDVYSCWKMDKFHASIIESQTRYFDGLFDRITGR